MIDLKKFKKVASDKHTTTLKHDDGHEFKVVHSVLSPKMRKEVERLPMADGGEVPNDPWEGHRLYDPKALSSKPGSSSEAGGIAPQSPPVEVTKIPKYHMADGGVTGRPLTDAEKRLDPGEIGDVVQPPPEGTKYAYDVTHPQPTREEGIPKSSSGSQLGELGIPVSEEIKHEDIFGSQPSLNEKASEQKPPLPSAPPTTLPDSYGILNGQVYPTKPGVEQNPIINQLNQISQQAQSPELARQTQQALTNNIRQNETIAQNFQTNKARIDAEHQALAHDIMNNHINMGDYWKHNDRGAAALGALLGGMGSGLTGLANPVPNMIANSQENFLKAELANMDNPKSLLSAVQAQYGNNRDAADVMRIISNEALNAHLQKVMAPLNSATAQANAAQVQMQLMQNTEAIKQQLAMRQALSSGAGGMDPHQKLLMMQRTGLIDKEDEKSATAELGSIDQANSLRKNLLSSYNDLNNRVLAGTFSPRDRQSAINAFAGQLEHAAEGRFNFQEAQTQMEAIMPRAGESDETRRLKLQRLHMLVDGLIKAPTLKKYGLLPQLDVRPR